MNIYNFFENKNNDNKNKEAVRKLLNTIPKPIFYKDKNGIYIECNKAFEEFVNFSRDEIVGKTVFDIAPEEFAEKYYEQDNELINNPGIQVYKFKVESSDKKQHDVIFKKSTFLNKKKEVLGLIGVITVLN